MAYTFQNRDLEVLGVPRVQDPKSKALNVLGEFWQTYEISGVSLVDMDIWNWMYQNPDATPAQLKEAVLKIAKDVWNRYYAPVFGQKDCTLLAVYSHIVHSFYYLPDYAIGHLINFQVERKIEQSGKVASEVERMCKLGRLTPDAWMKQATNRPLGAEALLEATAKALAKLH
jgi:oligoendopeptidase F